MKLLVHLFLPLFITLLPQQKTSDSYYLSLSSNEKNKIDEQIRSLEEQSTSSQTRAYYGAILMKRSSFEDIVKNKIAMFRKGHDLLEEEIDAFPKNIEYRFLRLAVQENAPNILGYNTDIKVDKSIIVKQYKELPSTLKSHILSYCKSSKILSSEELL
ncbi:MAG: hypothetical protein OEX22_00990 [Cyclobacteriaceae bacterium]|nr:hypothetical protein [Cyclobacteriaceae bacterium]